MSQKYFTSFHPYLMVLYALRFGRNGRNHQIAPAPGPLNNPVK